MIKKLGILFIITILFLAIIPASGTASIDQKETKKSYKPANAYFTIFLMQGQITDLQDYYDRVTFYAINVKCSYVQIGFGMRSGTEYWENEPIILSKTRGRVIYFQEGYSFFGIYITICGEM